MANAANPITRIINPDQRISGAASFTPDGRALVYPVREAGVDNLWLQPLDASASAAKRITNFTSGSNRRLPLLTRRQTTRRPAAPRSVRCGPAARHLEVSLSVA